MLATGSTVTNLPQIQKTNQKCGRRTGVDGRSFSFLFFSRDVCLVLKLPLTLTGKEKKKGFLRLVMLYPTDLWKTWLSPQHVSTSLVELSRTTTWYFLWSFHVFSEYVELDPRDLYWGLHCILLQYHGGTNFGRTSGGPFITTSYDYDAPIDEYGSVN